MPVSKTKVVSKNKASQGAPAVKPVWPPFEHLPYEDAERTITHRWPGQIVTIDNFWSPSLCKKYVSFLSGLPLVTTPGKPKKDEAVRINDRFQVDDATFAERLWSETGLREIVEQLASGDNDAALTTNEPRRRDFWEGAAIGLNPNIRVYRYTKGQLFNKHYDESNQVMHSGMPAKTTWTLLLYLTAATGGETVFYPEPESRKKSPIPDPVVVDLEIGTCLLHRHYPDCMLHEGREIVEGEKWVIRSDICVRK